MNHNQLNKCIEHYLDKDKTQSAIMLTGIWGSGKSHYIKHDLIPYLKEKKKDCVVVSLYGIKELNDISKAIYIELRSIKWFDSTEVSQTAKIVGKTVLKNIAQFVPMLKVDAEISINDMQALYESVNLAGKLIIFEDIERSHIDIIEFLGYVNNFVEQDGVKVMLVANEYAILNKDLPIDLRNSLEKQKDAFAQVLCKDTGAKTKEKDELLITENTKKYIMTKEKTVSDTIVYNGNYENAIKEIIDSFNNKYFDELVEEELIKKLATTIHSKDGNLRSFIFACQKTADIFDKVEKEYSADFMKCIFVGNVEFILEFRQRQIVKWDTQGILSTKLSSNAHPLFEFAYNYITTQADFSEADLDRADVAFGEFKLYDKNTKYQDDPDLNIIFDFHRSDEQEISQAFYNVQCRLEGKKDPKINLNIYGKLANYLIVISQYVNINLDQCKYFLVKNLENHKDILKKDYLFSWSYSIENSDKKAEYEDLKQQMVDALTNKRNIYEIEYTEKGIKELCESMYDSKVNYLSNEKFLQCINIELFVGMLKSCTAKTIDDIRQMFRSVYSSSNIGDFLSADAESMDELIKGISELLCECKRLECDRISILQLECLSQELREYRLKLN